MGCVKFTVIFGFVALPILAVLLQWGNSVDVESYYKNKRIVITGASEGIGKDLAIQLAQLGSRLVIAARTDSKLKETQRLCQNYTEDVYTVRADVGKEEDNQEIVNEAVKQLGGIDILILNAAYSPGPTPFVQFEDAGRLFLDVYKVNVLQSVYLTKQALPYLRESHGTILFVSSMTGLLGMPKFSPYCASKHALQGFIGSLRLEFEMQRENVSIVSMPLGFIYTERAVDSMKVKPNLLFEPGITSEDCARRMIAGIPLDRLYYFITWDSFFVGHLHSLCQPCFESLAYYFMTLFSDSF